MKHTDATKRKLSEMRKGALNPFFGRKHTPETLAKMAASTRTQNASRRYSKSPQAVRLPSGQSLGYLAGLIDGEGSIGIRKSGTPFITIYNTNSDVMAWLLANVGGSVGGSPDRRGRVPCYAWSIQAHRDVEAVISAVMPLLIAKAVDAATTFSQLEESDG